MKNIIVLLVFIFFCFQNTYCWEGIGVNVGGGYFFYYPPQQATDSPRLQPKESGSIGSGPTAFIAFDIPLVESHITEIELLLFQYWEKERKSYNQQTKVFDIGTIKRFYQSYGLRIYLFDYQTTIRPSIHIGATSIPIISWSFGIACDYKIKNDLHVQLSGWFMYDALITLAGRDNLPPMLNLSLKYYIK